MRRKDNTPDKHHYESDERYYDDYYDEHYNLEDEPDWNSYDEYGGYMGYDDDAIDSAFDGMPDAVWNID